MFTSMSECDFAVFRTFDENQHLVYDVVGMTQKVHLAHFTFRQYEPKDLGNVLHSLVQDGFKVCMR